MLPFLVFTDLLVAKDAAVLENELEELEVYGSSESVERKDEIPQYNFQVGSDLYRISQKIFYSKHAA